MHEILHVACSMFVCALRLHHVCVPPALPMSPCLLRFIKGATLLRILRQAKHAALSLRRCVWASPLLYVVADIFCLFGSCPAILPGIEMYTYSETATMRDSGQKINLIAQFFGVPA